MTAPETATGPAPDSAPGRDVPAAVAVMPGPIVGVRSRGGRAASLSGVLPPVVFGIAFLLLWQLVVQLFKIKPYVLPKPTAIAGQFVDRFHVISRAALATGTNALVGLVAGAIIGLLAALAASRLRWLDDMITPVAAAVATMPIVATAPALNTMFSSTSAVPRRIVVAITVFTPVFVNTVRGLRRISPVHAELMASYAARPGAILRLVRLPGALPFVFTGLRIASSVAVISAVVAEYFGGLQNGLGSQISSAASATAYPRAWAAVLAAIALGLIFYLAALLAERLAVPWRRPG